MDFAENKSDLEKMIRFIETIVIFYGTISINTQNSSFKHNLLFKAFSIY
jgi:hypothetical protein